MEVEQRVTARVRVEWVQRIVVVVVEVKSRARESDASRRVQFFPARRRIQPQTPRGILPRPAVAFLSRVFGFK